MKETVHLNLGSNIGDSHSILERAVAAVFQLHEGVEAPRRSAFVESEPWGFESANRFLNIGVEIETSLPPETLLDRLQQIESELVPGPNPHRYADGSYADRYLDIDIIFYGDMKMDTERLTLPHPRWRERDFVTVSVAELQTFKHLLES